MPAGTGRLAAVPRRRLLAALLLGVLLSACVGGGEDGGPPQSPSASPAPVPTPSVADTWPLTGVASDEPVGGPVLVVKVDNTAAGQPQRGLEAADLVVEEVVEGGLTRLAVMLHSQLPGAGSLVVGPVRSVRSSDVGVVAPTRGVLVASGGAAPPLADLAANGVRTVLEGSPGFVRDSARVAPYNLFVDVVEVAATLPTVTETVPSYVERTSGPVSLPPGRPADTLLLRFSAAHTTELGYDPVAGTWSREGDDFAATAVVALLVPTTDAGYLDPAGNPVPVTQTTGAGSGYVASGGRLVPVEWSKGAVDDPWTLLVDGGPVAVPAGRLYLALLPTSTGSVQPVAPLPDSGP